MACLNFNSDYIFIVILASKYFVKYILNQLKKTTLTCPLRSSFVWCPHRMIKGTITNAGITNAGWILCDLNQFRDSIAL